MKILWVKAGKLLPVDTGGKIRSYNILRQLTSGHEVTVLTFYRGQRDAEYESEVERHFPGAMTFHEFASDFHTAGRVVDYVRHLVSPAPYVVAKFRSPQVQRVLASAGDGRFDVAVCDFADAAVNFPLVPVIPTVLFQHNVESELWRRQADVESKWARKIVFQLEAAKMRRYETGVLRRLDCVIAVSENDRGLMGQVIDRSRITVVPTGVDLQLYRPMMGRQALEPLVVFTGSMDWEANIDAVEYFCREIWPLVRAVVPEARFRIVGRAPQGRVRKLACDSVEVTGTVPSVVSHLAEATVVVVPLRIGGGTRLKIYEAMATGRAVVSTSVGAEGLDVHHGKDIWLADTPRRFADGITMLIRDPVLRQTYENAAAQLAAQYDWPAIAERFLRVLDQVTTTSAIRGGQRALASEEVARKGLKAGKTRGRRQ